MCAGRGKKSCLVLLLISCTACVIDAFIVPEELPSILSLVYSNIPPVKKGLDSRVGLGFRLGDHADFQVLFEVGPQTNTQPLGTDETQRRRHVKIDIPTQKRQVSPTIDDNPKPDTAGSKWLAKWSAAQSKS